MKETVDGIILILSCQKYMHTRLQKYKLSQDYYNNWKVIYVIAGMGLTQEYEIRDGNYLWIKCEDSYIHLLKKLTLALEYVYELYDIKEGVLRCGDDLKFDEKRLMQFLASKKADYHGQHAEHKYIDQDYHAKLQQPHVYSKKELNNFRKCTWMYDYYLSHLEDLNNPEHNIQNIDISAYIYVPMIHNYAVGTLYFISNKACKFIMEHMKDIEYDIFKANRKYVPTYMRRHMCVEKYFPYIIEDIGVAYIMGLYNVPYTKDMGMNVICEHINEYK